MWWIEFARSGNQSGSAAQLVGLATDLGVCSEAAIYRVCIWIRLDACGILAVDESPCNSGAGAANKDGCAYRQRSTLTAARMSILAMAPPRCVPLNIRHGEVRLATTNGGDTGIPRFQ